MIELAFVGAVAGVAARRWSRGRVPGQWAWLGLFIVYVACHVFGRAPVQSRAVTGVVLSAGSAGVRHDLLQRVARSGDPRYRDVLLSELEKGSEPDVDEDLIGALTWLEDGAFWRRYLTSPRGSRWGISFRAKVLCDISNKSLYLQQAPGVDFARLTESFAALNMDAVRTHGGRASERAELLSPIFSIAFDNPGLGRSLLDRLYELLQRPSVAKCVRLGMSFRSEWSDPSHPRHRLYELAKATCQNFTKADLELWLSHR